MRPAILVCGGRDYWDRVTFDRVMRLHVASGVGIIHGGARGADSLAAEWALENEHPMRTFAADWAGHGRAAGPMRNQRMLEEGRPILVIAFPGGRGTADMVARAKAANVPVIEVAAD